MPARILVIGSMNMDLVVRTKRVPKAGETLLGEDFRTVPGGKGANQAVAAARLGAETMMLAKVGADGFGEELKGNLAACGVDIRHVLSDDNAPTGVAAILVLESGDNSIVVAPGANMELTPQNVETVLRESPNPDYILSQLEIPLETVEHAARLADEMNVPFVLDAGPARAKATDIEEILELAAIVSPNETEAEALVGVRVDSVKKAKEAASALHRHGARTVVLKLGERGALISDGKNMTHVPACEIEPVDSTAAGDAFTAALAVRLAEGANLEEAATFANRAGALACLTLGAQPSMPKREDVENFSP